MAQYTIKALDVDGYEICSNVVEEFGKPQAIKCARLRLNDNELIAAGLHTVQVCDRNDECVWDGFVS